MIYGIIQNDYSVLRSNSVDSEDDDGDEKDENDYEGGDDTGNEPNN